MTSSFDMRPERFTTGTVGVPGQRIFYLQGAVGDEVVTLRLEKQQVAALAEYLAGIVADLPAGESASNAMELTEPVIEEWVVASLGVAFDETTDRVLIVAEELVEIDEATELPVSEAATARFHLRRDQVESFIEHAVEVVLAGRPPCPICGRPMNPEGHQCPRSNGHRPS
jgi:uncharacterized repeat protein (TIGR03847 family)